MGSATPRIPREVWTALLTGTTDIPGQVLSQERLCAADLSGDETGALLYPLLRGCEEIPSQIISEMRRRHEDALVCNDYATARLGDLAPALTRHGRVVLMQGIALCEVIYRPPLVRPMSDVDLYLPDGTAVPVREDLVKRGFRQVGNHPYLLRDGGLCIDLHTDFWGGDRIPLRSRIAPDIDLDLRPSSLVPGYHIPGNEALALHAVYHGLKHGFGRAEWCLDIALLHGAGGFESEWARCHPVVRAVLDHLAQEGFLPPDGTSRSMVGPRYRLIRKLLDMSPRSGLGEVLLAAASPSWMGTVQYLAAALVPGRRILREMYGDLGTPGLMLRRIAALARSAWEFAI